MSAKFSEMERAGIVEAEQVRRVKLL